METPHLSSELFDRFANGELDEDTLHAVLDHLEDCETCAERGQARAADGLAAMRAEFEPSRVFQHRALWLGALAAAAALAFILFATVFRRPQPRPEQRTVPVVTTQPVVPPVESPRTYGRKDWDTWMTSVRAGDSLAVPNIVEQLRRTPENIRGSATPESPLALSPSAVVIDDARPTFTWKGHAGERAMVTVVADDREAARSEWISTQTWTPAKALPRGVTYTWQVEIERDGETVVFPAPPAPPARFHVIDEATHAELEQARQRFAADPLFLGVLYARAGLLDEAHEELRRVHTPSDIPAAQRLLHEVDSWSTSRVSR